MSDVPNLVRLQLEMAIQERLVFGHTCSQLKSRRRTSRAASSSAISGLSPGPETKENKLKVLKMWEKARLKRQGATTSLMVAHLVYFM